MSGELTTCPILYDPSKPAQLQPGVIRLQDQPLPVRLHDPENGFQSADTERRQLLQRRVLAIVACPATLLELAHQGLLAILAISETADKGAITMRALFLGNLHHIAVYPIIDPFRLMRLAIRQGRKSLQLPKALHVAVDGLLRAAAQEDDEQQQADRPPNLSISIHAFIPDLFISITIPSCGS